MKLLRWVAAVLAASLMASAAQAAPVTVFAAASLKNALDEVGAQYVKSGGAARFSYAASSAIARQIEQGAPADIFVSADSDWMSSSRRCGAANSTWVRSASTRVSASMRLARLSSLASERGAMAR